MDNLTATILHGRFDTLPNFVAIRDIISVSGHKFVWNEMNDGNYSVGWINPADNIVHFVCQRKATGELLLSTLQDPATGMTLLGFKGDDRQKVSSEIVDEFGLGEA